MTRPQRIIFAGSPAFAVPALQVLAESQHELVAVLTQPDRPAGRGQKTRISPVKARATELDITVLQPESLSDSEALEQIQSYRPDLMVVVAYGLILPARVLTIPGAGCVNLHASLLPRWRGAAPIQAAILAGDRSTGISLMKMDAGLDTGPVYTTRSVDIGADENAGQLHDRLAQLGADLLAETLDDLLAGRCQPVPQAADGACYAARLHKKDALIDWQQTAQHIHARIRAYNPWPVAHTWLDGEVLRCWSAVLPPDDEPASQPDRRPVCAPGTVINTGPEGIDVQTGAGRLRLLSVQMPGRKRMTATDFLNGREVLHKTLGLH